jgi:hypothetical protein
LLVKTAGFEDQATCTLKHSDNAPKIYKLYSKFITKGGMILTLNNARETKLLIVALAMLVFMAVSHASDQQSPLTEKERQLADLVNQYRQDNDLSALPVTNSLTKVARTHVVDLNTYHPDTQTYGTGICNRHSWSDHGIWTPVCYTGNSQAAQMWNKPREITESYDGSGYEIACWNSQEITPSAAMDEWKGSSDHCDTILQQGIFAGTTWQAMGVGIDGNYAVVWFGEEVDPAGPVSTQSDAITDYPDGVCAFSCLTLEPKKPNYNQGETVQFVLKKVTPGSVNLEGAYYQIQKEVDSQWKNYYKVPDGWRFKTPVIEYGGKAKGISWDQRQKGDLDNIASKGHYRMKFYAPNAFDGFMTAEFKIV